MTERYCVTIDDGLFLAELEKRGADLAAQFNDLDGQRAEAVTRLNIIDGQIGKLKSEIASFANIIGNFKARRCRAEVAARREAKP